MINIDISDRTYAELFGAIAGLFLLFYGNGKRAQFSRLLKNGIRVEGEVVEIKAKRWNWGTNNSRPTPTYYPVIHFETIDSGPIAGDYDLVTSNPPAYKLWEKVKVAYDPANHKNFILDNLSTKLFGLIIMFAGFPIVSAAVIFYILDPDSYIRF